MRICLCISSGPGAYSRESSAEAAAAQGATAQQQQQQQWQQQQQLLLLLRRVAQLAWAAVRRRAAPLWRLEEHGSS